ncbi:MAG TPA: hypothetical protein VNG32_04765 [Candidatus Dormibacteraeota bacterium]|nr:hypothetical protein [Candidatus Dormibacteraeota bacterium]
MRSTDCLPNIAIGGRPDVSESVLSARQSDLEDFRRGRGMLYLGRNTLMLADSLDYSEPKVLTGGHMLANCSMTIEGVDQLYKGRVRVPLPGRVHSWIRENIFDPASPEPNLSVFVESWPAEPGPNVA